MNAKQNIINRLSKRGLDVSSNQIEVLLFEYKKLFGGKYRSIDLIFDMIDDANDFEKFVEFINKNRAGDCLLYTPPPVKSKESDFKLNRQKYVFIPNFKQVHSKKQTWRKFNGGN